MAEAVFRVLQLGVESAFGTSVAATTIFPCEPGSGEFELDRSVESPDEDYGVIARHQANRGSNGVRIATGSLSSAVRFEDIGQMLRITGSNVVNAGAGPYTHTYTLDQISNTIKSATVEVNDDTQDWIVAGVHCTSLQLGYDVLTAPGNSPWNLSADLRGVNKVKGTATAALSAPATLETVEGQFTRIYAGAVATAFGSLPELTDSLLSYSVTIADPKPLRIYGAATGDIATGYGRQKREISFEAQLKESSTITAEMFDIFNVTGAFPTDRRWRVQAAGSSGKLLTIDGRVRFTSVNVNPDVRDGERVYAVAGYYVYDTTLASDLQIVVTDNVATLP